MQSQERVDGHIEPLVDRQIAEHSQTKRPASRRARAADVDRYDTGKDRFEVALGRILTAEILDHSIAMDNVDATAAHAAIDPSHPAVVPVDITIGVMVQIDAMASPTTDENKQDSQQQAGPGVGHKVQRTIGIAAAERELDQAADGSQETDPVGVWSDLFSAMRPIAEEERPRLLKSPQNSLGDQRHARHRRRDRPNRPELRSAIIRRFIGCHACGPIQPRRGVIERGIPCRIADDAVLAARLRAVYRRKPTPRVVI